MIETFILLYIGTGIGIWFMVFCEEEKDFNFDSISWWADEAFDFFATVAFMWLLFAALKLENARHDHKIRQKEEREHNARYRS